MNLMAYVVTRGRLDYLKRCVETVLAALPPGGKLRVLVNGENPETERWLGSLAHEALEWSAVSAEPRTRARNRAFDVADCDVIHFLDDDVEVPPEIFRETLRRLEADPALAILGGPNLTPAGSTRTQAVFGAVMTSPFAAPLVRVRYGSGLQAERPATERDLILCNLAVRAAAVPEDVRFPDDNRGGEENVFIYRCLRRGLKASFSSAVYLYHQRRRSFWQFARQVYGCGFGRAQQTIAEPASVHPFFFAPPAACAYLAACVQSPRMALLLPPLAASYALLSAAGSLLSAEARSLGAGGLLAVSLCTPSVHLAWGAGFWHGLIHEALRLRPGRRR